jgi:hypothetical protein
MYAAFFAQQMKRAVLDQHVLHQRDRVADRTFGNAEVVSKMFHRPILPPVLQGKEQLVADRKLGSPTAFAVPLLIGNGQDTVHVAQNFLWDTEKFFEILILLTKGVRPAFHRNTLEGREK